ncbi:ACT domain-containing protein [Jutongia sp.]|jgi:ACT domain-containing protein|uniref:ACT domain-containing protein n=1 Tax=Jutongia sp. TaxID=2944204 RepID=UPI00307ABDAF
MRKIVITVVGKDSVGIIAGVCTYLADHQVNILDISQTIVDGFFNMMMIVDTAKYDGDFDTFAADLEEIGKELGCIIHAQREDIFDQMHRI